MNLKRKLAGLMAALMVLTLGSATAFAETTDSPGAGDYSKIEENIATGIVYVATGTDSKTPWVEIEGAAAKNLDASVTAALAYKSAKNPNPAVGVNIKGADLSSVKVSKANMSTLASRKGYINISGDSGSDYFSMYMSVTNAKALDISIAYKSNDKATAKLKAVGYTKESCQITIGGTGSLPGNIAIVGERGYGDPGTGWASNCKVYYYNAAQDLFVERGTAGMYKDGSVVRMYGGIITAAGTYVITVEKLPAAATTGTAVDVSNKKTDAAVTTAVTSEIANAAKGDTIIINNLAAGLKVEQSIFTAAKEKGVSIAVDSPKNNASFKFSNFDKVAEMSGAFDPTVSIGDAIVPDIDKVMAAGKNSKVSYVTVSFAYDGKLPGKTDVTLDLSEGGFTEGQTIYLYYFNEKTKAFELVDDAKYANGSAVFQMEHCSDYIVTAQKLATTSASPKTGDTAPIALLTVVLFAGIALVGFFARKKRA